MSKTTRRSIVLSVTAIALAAFAIGLSVSDADAHRPGFTAEPFFTGDLRVGGTLTGDYNTKVCDPACHVIEYQWIACDYEGGGGFDGPPGGLPDTSRPCPGASPANIIGLRSPSQTFVIPPALAGRRVQLEVFLGANDCDALGQNCRYVEAHAYSPASARILAGPPPPPPPPPAPTVDVRGAIATLRNDIIRLRAEGASWAAIKVDASWLACHEYLLGCR